MSLIYRDQNLREDGLRLSLIRGFAEPVEVRGEDVIVPGAVGRFSRNRVADVRRILLEGYIMGNTPAEWREATDLAMALFDTTLDPGDLQVVYPYLGFATGTYTISARCINAVATVGITVEGAK